MSGHAPRLSPIAPQPTALCYDCAQELAPPDFRTRLESWNGLMHACRSCLRRQRTDTRRSRDAALKTIRQ